MSGSFAFAATEVALLRAASSGTLQAAAHLADAWAAAGFAASAQGNADGSATVTLAGGGSAPAKAGSVWTANAAGMMAAFAEAVSAALAESGQ